MAHAKPDEERSNGEEQLDRCGSGSSHFLVVAYGIQGHLNPARALARRLARTSTGGGGCKATLSVPLSGHRRMFPSSLNTSSSSADDQEEEENVVGDGVISYVPYSDGRDDGSWPKDAEERAQRRDAAFNSLSAIVSRSASRGQPVTAMVCTLSMPVVVQVARHHGIPLVVYWIQPATTLAAYYHYFHGYDELIHAHRDEPAFEVTFPGLQSNPVKIRDMPSFLTEKDDDTPNNGMSEIIMRAFQELFQEIDRERPVVLVNTFAALEKAALEALEPYMDVVAVGPAVPPPPPPLGADEEQVKKVTSSEEAEEAQIHLFKQDEKDYMEWLDTQPEKSVVYLSFGSLLTYTKRQLEEILEGLERCGRPYLWVVRRDGSSSSVDFFFDSSSSSSQAAAVTNNKGMVVEWCDQLQVLRHPSVGCFVTHCGWNSTLEAIVSGVPMVAVPSWSDQPLNAHLVEEVWRVGVRAVRDAEGVLTQEELVRCVELVMGDDGSEAAVKVKENASSLKKKAQDVFGASGPLEQALRGFVDRLQDQNGA